ncbi:aspartate/glutamate racemase family protein [Amycolatopsis aidingensis]|uniref:aspartate/glutamate racemase family protein n=1 Tax=Amycolatopsis aidingensis TaxID=2842453 RepID=UPI001C0DEC79|nr:aspartate/glutamate racemase family protein [Amycolatopsis aidingensis]
MKTIGLLGGMSWESSAEYYRLLNESVRDTLGGFHSARCVLYSVDFAEIERMQAEERWEDAGQALLAAGTALRRAGAEVLVLCTNTMHKVADLLAEGLDIPLLHLADACADSIIRAGLRRVGLLGTGFTMAQPFYRDRLAAHGLEVLVPEPEDRERVHRIIYQELVLGVVTEESRQAYREVMARLVAAGAQGMIYGCTEIELLVGPQDSPVPTFPTTRLHVEAAAGYALGRAPLPPAPGGRVISVPVWKRATRSARRG